MNCIAFRRALSVRPASQEREVLGHRRVCVDCDAFARRQADFERTLGEAVKIPVPEGLPSRILVAHGVRLEGERRARRGRLGRAFAAGLAVMLVASWLNRPAPLERAVIAHIDEERSHLDDRRDLSAEQVNQVLAPLRIVVESSVGPIHYAGTCRIGKHLGAHLVLQGERGPVTVLFLPAEPIVGRVPVRGSRLQGIVVPAARGSMAIVGGAGEALEPIEERLRRAVRFASREGPRLALRHRERGRGA